MSGKQKSTRRDFLVGRAMVRAVEDLLPAESPPEPESLRRLEPTEGASSDRSASAAYVIQVARDAMACQFEVMLNAGQHTHGTEAALDALDLVERLEQQLTVYRTTSEVSRLNQLAHAGPVRVEKRLFRLLELAVELFQSTGGAFDITSGPLTKAWGFYRREGRFPAADELAEALTKVGSRGLLLDPSNQTVAFQHPELEINLGAIGKGYALDRCAELLLERGVTDFLLHGGGSSVLARGRRWDGQAEQAGWSIGLRHPLRYEQRLAEIWLDNQASATSGSGNQFFHFQGQRYGHVIDPRTGYPADRLLSSTVLAPDAATADALATAFYVLGVEPSLEICRQRPELAAVLIRATERRGEVELITAGLDDYQWRRL